MLLGAPIGPPSFCNQFVLERVNKVLTIVPLLSALQDSQMAITLLRSCLSFPKMAFVLRTTPPCFISEATHIFDTLLREALENLLGSPVSEWSWLKSSLPCSMGGLNLRSAYKHSSAAYLSSSLQCINLVRAITGSSPDSYSPHVNVAFASLNESSNSTWLSVEDIDIPITQRGFSKLINMALFNDLLASAPDSRSKALALSTSIKHAGDWLSAIPSKALGLHFHDLEFRLCTQYWLGIHMCPEGACALCGSERVDPFGDHHVVCGGNSDRIMRHDLLRDAIFAAARSAALSPKMEIPSLIPGSNNRPADIYIPTWSRGSPAALDVTVISPLQQLTVDRAAITQGHALQVAHNRKVATHDAPCREAGVQFIPLPVETLGGWSKGAAATLRDIGHRQGLRLGIPPSDSIHHLFQRLSVRLWRGNAAMWIHRSIPPPSEIDGIP